MVPKYIPVLKAMRSESIALANIDPAHAKKMLPLFEVPRIGQSIRNAKRFEGCTALTTAYLDEVTDRIAVNWSGRAAMVDAYQWPADATVESGEHVIPYIFTRLHSLGVDVVPVIGYDRWSEPTYSLALQGLELPDPPYYCIRLDALAIEDAAEPEFFLDNIQSLLANFSLEPGGCSVLIDFGDVSSRSVEQLLDDSGSILNLLMPLGFLYFATAGCSLPKSIDLAVKKPDTVGKLVRKEVLLWQATRVQYPNTALVYGDYGIRGPSSNEGIPNPNANGKIRYTIDKHFLVVRGHSMKLLGKGEQMWGLAQKVVESAHYLGPGFSWGDKQILDCSQKKIKGHHAQWISNDTSHHLAYALAEVEQFDLSIAVPAPSKFKPPARPFNVGVFMAKPVHLSNGRTWQTKKEALAHFRTMLSRYAEGDRITIEADHGDLCSLLVRYDSTLHEGTSKIGTGIEHFSKQRNTGEGWSTVGFHVHRTDGTSDDFSFIAAVNIDTPASA